jgi:hypothetical protein
MKNVKLKVLNSKKIAKLLLWLIVRQNSSIRHPSIRHISRNYNDIRSKIDQYVMWTRTTRGDFLSCYAYVGKGAMGNTHGECGGLVIYTVHIFYWVILLFDLTI